jgi:GNAT superfamily N-acetyltransferase
MAILTIKAKERSTDFARDSCLDMAPQLRGLGPQLPEDRNTTLPGITFAEKDGKTQDISSSPEPASFNGPQINGRPTTLTLFSPRELASSPLLPSLYKVINDAFRDGREKSNYKVPHSRLQYDGQLHDELGNKPGTFTFVLYYTGTLDVVATASAKPHADELHVAQISGTASPEKDESTMWKRLAPIPEGKVAWELSTMAVDWTVQRQGLAGYLMRLTEEEVKRRHQASDSTSEKQLILVITTNKERNGLFYLRRGFEKDYEIWYEKGFVGNEKDFHIIFMSRPVDI